MLQIFSHFCKYFSTGSNILHVEVLATVAAVSCDPYTVGQVAHGFTHGGVITGVDYGHGLVSGYGALGNRAAVYGSYGYPHSAYYGKREAEAEPWTIGQVAAGLPLANAAWEGRLRRSECRRGAEASSSEERTEGARSRCAWGTHTKSD